jgi:thioredoxin-like negative regulator of GroEL
MQILRATPAAAASGLVVRAVNDPTYVRTAATNVLARSGRLSQLIDRANEELRKTTNAVQIHQTLADYYTAARQPARARAERIKVAELRPDDAGLRFQVANQLAQEGQDDAAVPHFLAAFKKDISQIDRIAVARLIDIFRKAGRLGALLDLLAEKDIPSIVSSYVVANLVQEFLGDDRLRDRALDVLRRYWKANPTYQLTLLSYINSDAPWRMPEMYELARTALLSPDSARTNRFAQWDPFQGTITRRVAGTGQATPPSPAARLMDLAEGRGQLDDLAAGIASARKTRIDWPAADFYLALIACRSGRYDEARAIVRKLADPKTKDETLTSSVWPIFAYVALGRELEAHPAMADDALAFYERAASLPYSLYFLQFGLEHPVTRLIALYERLGRIEDVRRVALGFPRQPVTDTGSDEFVKHCRVYAAREMARKLVDLGYAADAVPLYSEAIVLADETRPDNRTYFADSEQFPKQLREALESTLAGLATDELAPIAGRFIAEASAPRPAGIEARSTRDKGSDQALDLLTIVYPRALDKARIRGLLAESLTVCDARQLAALDEPLETLRQAHPDDLSVAIAAALQALASTESSRVGLALERLDRLVERTPLEPLPPGGRANARQRDEAARQIPLWLVARACEKRPDAAAYRTLAHRLSARALEAARRQADNLTMLAMVREQGEIALSRGDRKGAEAAWGQMLDLVMPADLAQTRRPRPVPGGTERAIPGSPTPRTPTPARTRPPSSAN